MARHTSGSGSGVFVTALTGAAVAVVAFFAFQASAADDSPVADRAGASPSEGATDGAEAEVTEDPLAIPENSGEGRRVVYALERQRVWMVDAQGAAVDTYEVHPSSVSPPVGQYTVTSRWTQGSGSDGVPIENSVVFHTAADGIVFGFSAALDGSFPDPDAELRTGGIRQSRENGDTMWLFAEEGTAVVVVP